MTEEEKKNKKRKAPLGSKLNHVWEAIFILLAVLIIAGIPFIAYARNRALASSRNQSQVFNILARNDAGDNHGRWLVQTGSNWDYSNLSAPSDITVKEGDTVTLRLTSFDVTHGFELDEFNIDEPVYAGKFTYVTFTADKTGKFPFECDVYCGMGHADMTGWLIVEPQS